MTITPARREAYAMCHRTNVELKNVELKYAIEVRMQEIFEAREAAGEIEGYDWPLYDDEVRQEAEQQLAHAEVCGPIEGSEARGIEGEDWPRDSAALCLCASPQRIGDTDGV
jgi:hypothetical protein